ncbi:hypothetical protein ER308_06550 [Egibacter rhizosphaerae]|uniref:Uncharacterized protein n=1 Tax=Egibacter rhizosphaerae TaxID=1670831 RepID=A0A411YDD8_9ACTN|nr:hypothetical protein [Egibacter rhizosphaerae]QBI19233.1 hypothetical protein ER308_06550 [Egibacter rhizosphaerae]
MSMLVVGFLLLIVVPVLLSYLVAGAARSAHRMHWLSMDEELSIEPETGYKTAQVLVARSGFHGMLSGVTEGSAYEADATATCKRSDCDPPGLDCVCGFYSFKSRAEAERMLGQRIGYYGTRPTAFLTVELDGSVLEYERGYRAERQNVVGVEILDGCDLCERFGVSRDATTLAASETFIPRRFSGMGRPTVHVPDGYLPVRPVCDDHVPNDETAIRLDSAELGFLLNAKVTWRSPPDAKSPVA